MGGLIAIPFTIERHCWNCNYTIILHGTFNENLEVTCENPVCTRCETKLDLLLVGQDMAFEQLARSLMGQLL